MPVISGLLSFYCIAFISCGDTRSLAEQNRSDSAMVAGGEQLFQQHCSSCHSIDQQGIGPALGGITGEVPDDWLRAFIRDPQQLINAGDPRADALFKKYNVYMPAFSWLSDQELDRLMAYLDTKNASAAGKTLSRHGALKDPITDSIAMSDLIIELEYITQIPPSSSKQPATRIAKMDFPAGTERLFVHDLRGRMYELVENQPHEYLDVAAAFPDFIHEPGLATGFGSFAFHPEFTSNGLVYTTHTEAAGSAPADFAYADSIPVHLQWVLMEWQTGNPDGRPFQPMQKRELLRVNMVMQLHGLQEVTFNPLSQPGDEDYGLLYISVGDGGAVEKGYPFLVQSREKIWGSIIRIDPAGRNSTNKKYGIPASNPFAADDAAVKELYAYGFRNPHRISWTQTGLMLATNIGHSHIESLNIVKPGDNFGWPLREGTFELRPEEDMSTLYPLPEDDGRFGITYPAAQYDHTDGNAICGGYEYTGAMLPGLLGRYFFGDIPRGRLFFVETASLQRGGQTLIREWRVALGGKIMPLDEICGDKRVDLRFGRDHRGELYLFTKPDGKIYRFDKVLERGV